MELKKVGVVTEEEKKQIEALFERKNGLQELVNLLKSNSVLESEDNTLYEKLVKDMGKTKTSFDKWWTDMNQKYQWEGKEGYSFQINFSTNEIFLT